MDRGRSATYAAFPAARVMLDAATDFGLSREEAWQKFREALAGAHSDATVPEYLDEVAGALAQEILSKQRRILGEQFF